MRKVLEQENICDSLRGRIQYFLTRYRKSHDQEGRVAIRLDGTEIFRSDYYDWNTKRYQARRRIDASEGRSTNYSESGAQSELQALRQGGYEPHIFFRAFHTYYNGSIADSLCSPDPMVRLFAVLDKRVGKRRLDGLAKTIDAQPEWLQTFYRLRLSSDGIVEIARVEPGAPFR